MIIFFFFCETNVVGQFCVRKKNILRVKSVRILHSNMFYRKSSVKIYCCRSVTIGWFIQCEKRFFLNHFVPLPTRCLRLDRDHRLSLLISPPKMFCLLLLSILLDFLPNIWRQNFSTILGHDFSFPRTYIIKCYRCFRT